jgi:hypothetical protein
MRILFPRDYFSPKKPDEMFSDQFAAFQESGFQCSTIDIDSLEASSKIVPAIEAQTTLYRGWMLNTDDYVTLCAAISANGGTPFTNTEHYLSAHHLPRWYPKLKEFTPETVVLDKNADLEKELRDLGWEKYFIKDYVKSLKTSIGSIITSPEQIKLVVAEMEKFRGEIEGGICVRKVETFVPETETRYFVIEGIPYGPSKNPIPDIVKECVKLIESKFFSIDVVNNIAGIQRIVEIGDGQVSDIVGWVPERFVEIWKNHS